MPSQLQLMLQRRHYAFALLEFVANKFLLLLLLLQIHVLTNFLQSHALQETIIRLHHQTIIYLCKTIQSSAHRMAARQHEVALITVHSKTLVKANN